MKTNFSIVSKPANSFMNTIAQVSFIAETPEDKQFLNRAKRLQFNEQEKEVFDNMIISACPSRYAVISAIDVTINDSGIIRLFVTDK